MLLAAVVAEEGWSMKEVLGAAGRTAMFGAAGGGAVGWDVGWDVGWCCWGGRYANQVDQCFHGFLS